MISMLLQGACSKSIHDRCAHSNSELFGTLSHKGINESKQLDHNNDRHQCHGGDNFGVNLKLNCRRTNNHSSINWSCSFLIKWPRYSVYTFKWQMTSYELQVTSDKWHVTLDTWHVTRDTWHVTRDTWHVTSGKWQVTSDKWQVASGKWQVTSDKWQVTSDKCAWCKCAWRNESFKSTHKTGQYKNNLQKRRETNARNSWCCKSAHLRFEKWTVFRFYSDAHPLWEMHAWFLKT